MLDLLRGRLDHDQASLRSGNISLHQHVAFFSIDLDDFKVLVGGSEASIVARHRRILFDTTVVSAGGSQRTDMSVRGTCTMGLR